MSFLSFQKIKQPLIMTVAYFLVFPVLNSMLGGIFGGFGGTMATALVFAVFVYIGLYIGKFLGAPMPTGKQAIKVVAITTLLYVFAFGLISGVVSPVASVLGTMSQYLVVFVFFWLSAQLSQMLGKKI